MRITTDSVVANSVLTIDQLMDRYRHGYRHFRHCTFLCRHQHKVELPFLSDVLFEDCHLQTQSLNTCFVIKENPQSIVKIHASDFYDPEIGLFDLDGILYFIQNKQFQKKYAQKIKYICFSSKFFFELMPELTHSQIDILDCLDLRDCLSDCKNIRNQIEWVDQLLSFGFSRCRFQHGILLPDFILNQCEEKDLIQKKLAEERPSYHLLLSTLRKAKNGLVLLEEQIETNSQPNKKMKYRFNDKFKRIISGQKNETKEISTTVSQDVVKAILDEKKYYWRGCIIQDKIVFSKKRQTRIVRCDFQNAQFCHEVDFSNTILSGVKMQGASFEKGIIINDKTDFRGCADIPKWKNNMSIYCWMADEKNDLIEFQGTVADFYHALKSEYLSLRKQKKIGWLRSNYIHDLENHLCKETEENKNEVFGKRLFLLLNHMQKKRGLMTGKKNSRTFNAFQNTLKKHLKPSITPTRESKQRSSYNTPEPIIVEEKKPHPLTEFFDKKTGTLHDDKILAKRDIFQRALSESTDIFQIEMQKWKTESHNLLQATLSSFYKSPYLFGNDDGSAIAFQHRKKMEDRIVTSYLFLKMICPDEVKQYDHLLKECIYPNYLKYVVYRNRICDQDGNQILFFRYSLFEKLFREMSLQKEGQSISLDFLSAHRNDTVSKPNFFSSHSDFGQQFIAYCQSEWAKLSLEQCARADCLSQKQLQFICHLMQQDHVQTTITEERSYWIATLIQGEGESKNYLKTELTLFCNTHGFEKLNQHIIYEAAATLLDKVISEIKNNRTVDGYYAQQFDHVASIFNTLPCDQGSLLFAEMKTRLMILKRTKKMISGGLKIFQTLQLITQLLNQHKKIPVSMIESISTFQNDYLVWFGNSDDLQATCDSIPCHLLSTHYELHKSLITLIKKFQPIDVFSLHQPPAIMSATCLSQLKMSFYHAHFVTQKMKTILLNCFAYSKIKSEAKTPEGFLSKTITPENAVSYPDQNAFKFSALVHLQTLFYEQLQRIESPDCSIERLSEFFKSLQDCVATIIELIEHKKENHRNLFYEASFYDRVLQTSQEMHQLKMQWLSRVTETISLETHSDEHASRRPSVFN